MKVVLLIVGWVLAAGWCACGMIKHSERYYAQMDKFMVQATQSNKEELKVLYSEVLEYAKTNAHARQYGARAKEVLAYIKGRYNAL